jgi:cardiolipin synthase
VSAIDWSSGNFLRLLENGETFFPAVIEAIGKASREVLLETFILAEDGVGGELRDALAAAARRGVRVVAVVDGYGTAQLSPHFRNTLIDAGVTLRWFDPRPRLLGVRTNLFRRLHRKLVVVDGAVAFVGGINFSDEHLRSHGPTSKQDYAVEVRGPVVEQVRQAMTRPRRHPGPGPDGKLRWWRRPRGVAGAAADGSSPARAALVLRDDEGHSQDIERMYRLGIRAARREIIIANAYFFPGYRLLRDLRDAARRGVAVHLILQGRPDMPAVRWAAATLYDYLLRGGVHIHEYCERPLHGKVAVIDGVWATVGSSNLDPLSLFLNLEANLVVEDAAFATELHGCLDRLIRSQCRELSAPRAGPSTLLRNAAGVAAFHLLRRLPRLAGWLPAHGAASLLRGADEAAQDAAPAIAPTRLRHS